MLEAGVSYFFKMKGSKFNILKSAHKERLIPIQKYDCVWVCDDDLTLLEGNPCDLAKIMTTYNLEIVSPCHSGEGSWSHQIMLRHFGNRILRYTNFAEMGYPMFRSNSLIKFLDIYDGGIERGDWIDWYYLNVLECNTKSNCAIIDNILVLNPHPWQKPLKVRELTKHLTKPAISQDEFIQKYNTVVWEHQNLSQVKPIDPSPESRYFGQRHIYRLYWIGRRYIPEYFKKTLRPLYSPIIKKALWM